MTARLFFVHIPKCAGVTLHHIIDGEYAPEELYTVPGVPPMGWTEASYESLRDEWSDEAKEKIKVVKGHMPYGWHRAFKGAHEYITILRDPIERVLSYYDFISHSHQDYPYKGQGLEHFVKTAPGAQNHMTYMLSGAQGKDAAALRVAWQNLSEMAVVGTVKKFDEMVKKLRARYGWSDGPYSPQNQTPNRVEVSDEMRRLVASRNVYDLMLYANTMR